MDLIIQVKFRFLGYTFGTLNERLPIGFLILRQVRESGASEATLTIIAQALDRVKATLLDTRGVFVAID